MSSFDTVNYAIRPNKSVERTIAFAGLVRLSHILDLSKYRYIGLGSLWFVDFIMAHKLLGITDMISMERSEMGYKRSLFNRPISCIKVLAGETTLLIPTLGLESMPSLLWFDYDSSIGGPVVRDIELLAPKCAPNSVLIVTISAKKHDLPTKDENDSSIDTETSLRRIAGDLVPTPLAPKRLQPSNYPKLLCEVLTNQLIGATVNSGRSETFIKLFDMVYSDGTPMVTVGGVVASADRVDSIRQLIASPSWEGILTETIAIPPLTMREKLALDQMMPSPLPPTDAEMNRIGFHLKREQIDTYHRHYLHYPMFGEVF